LITAISDTNSQLNNCATSIRRAKTWSSEMSLDLQLLHATPPGIFPSISAHNWMLQNTTVSKNSQYLVLADHMSKKCQGRLGQPYWSGGVDSASGGIVYPRVWLLRLPYYGSSLSGGERYPGEILGNHKIMGKNGHLYSSVRAVTARLRKSAKAIPAGSA
jgi:hypothetical protein